MKNLIYVVAVVVVGLVAVFCFRVDAGMKANSLNGYHFGYNDIARKELGFSSDESWVFAPFCGGQAIQSQLDKPFAEMICLPQAKANSTKDCSPVASVGHVPDYIMPYSDHLTANLAVVTDNIEHMSKVLQNVTSQTALNAGADVGRASITGRGNKVITSKQCEGYGYISIQQDYY